MPILTCIFFTFNWLTLTSQMHFVKFHPEVASCLLSRGKRKYAPLGMRLLWKYIRNCFLVYHLISHFFVISPKLQRIWSWNFGFAISQIWAFIWYQKIYYFRLSPGGWECDRHKGLKLFSFSTYVLRRNCCHCDTSPFPLPKIVYILGWK